VSPINEKISLSRQNYKLLNVKVHTYEYLSKFVSTDFKLDEALNYTLDILIDLFQVKAGSIMLLDSAHKVLDFSVVRGDQSHLLKNLTIKKGEGIAGKVAQSGRPIIVNDTSKNPDFNINTARKIGYVPKTILCVPLKVKGGIYGIIELMEHKDNSGFTETDLQLLQSIASPISIMVENITLYNLTETDVNRLRTLMKVNNVINTTMDVDQLLEYIMSSAKEILKCEGSSLLLIDEKSKELYFNVVDSDSKEALKEIRVPLGIGIAGIVAKTGESLLINDAENDNRVFRKADEVTNIKTRNILCVPMKVQNRIIGVLEVINSFGKPFFDDYDLSLFHAMADQASIALHNRGLIDSLQTSNVSLEKRIKELSTINKISHFMSKSFEYDIEDILSKTIRSISDILEITRISIFFHDAKKNKLKIMDAVGIKRDCFNEIEIAMDNKIISRVFSKGFPLLVQDITKEKKYGRYKRLRYNTKSFICMPIKVKDKVIGILNFADKKSGSFFDKDDLQTLETISMQVSEAYENSMFYKEVMEKQRIEKELEIAYDIQQSILPKKFPLPDILDIAATSIPAQEIGGDFYDIIECGDNQIASYIADVSGKGIPASLFMALSRSVLRIQAMNKKFPSSAIEGANNFILADSKNGMFVTLFYFYLDLNHRKMHYGCAGHNDQFYYNCKTDTLSLIKATGIPLGILPSPFFSEEIIDYNDGDFIVLFTDGVIEAINQKNEEYGIERLTEVIRSSKDEPADHILKNIQNDVEKYYGDVKQFDDLTLLILKFL